MSGAFANGKFYFAGGVQAGALNVSTDVIDIYDGSVWTTDHLSLSRAAVMSVVVNNTVYFMGGAEFDISFLPFPNTGGTYNTVDVLNTSNGNWSRQDFIYPHHDPFFNVDIWPIYAGFSTWGNKIFIAGGGSSEVVQGNSMIYYAKNVEILDVTKTGFENIDESFLLDVFPNPSSGTFSIALPGSQADISILDSYGREVMNLKAVGQKTQLRLDQSGVYVVKVLTPHGTATRKLVIDR